MHKIKLMVADDEVGIRMPVRRLLINAGYEVLQAVNGFEVVALLTEHRDAGAPVALVVLDVTMPDCSGLEALKLLQDFSPFPKIVLMTGNASIRAATPDVMQRCSGVLWKPITEVELLAGVATALATPVGATVVKGG